LLLTRTDVLRIELDRAWITESRLRRDAGTTCLGFEAERLIHARQLGAR
jgi:hypothetical protein